jgi:Winged helix DNA-binding domain
VRLRSHKQPSGLPTIGRMVAVDQPQIQSFRLERHHLNRRLPAGGLVDATAACGIQETPKLTAALALHARVDDVTVADVGRALKRNKTLLTIWAMRGAPYVVPTGEAAIFTAGALPVGEDSWRRFFGGWATSLSERDASLSALVQRAAEATFEVLDGRELAVEDLRQEIAKRMPEIRGLQRPSGAHADLPEPLFRAIGQQGVVCIADTRTMTDAILARTDQWLGEPPPPPDQDGASAELLRRYLRCYGPSTQRAFAEWTLRSAADVRTTFEAIMSELVEIRVERTVELLLAADIDDLASPAEPTGVRLLPAHDPFLQQRDRYRLLPDSELRKRLWRPVGSPGLVLIDGQAKAIWSSHREGKTLRIIVDPFGPLRKSERHAISDEADSIAPLRGADQSALTVNE